MPQTYKNSGDEISAAAKKGIQAAKAAKRGIKAAKGATGAAKAGVAAAKAGAAAIGWPALLVIIGIFLLIMVITVATPSTSFNSVTHINEKQDPVTQAELEGEVRDLDPAVEAEADAVNIIGTVLKDEKSAAYKKLEEECKALRAKGINANYEATLQYLETNFANISSDIFTQLGDEQWSDDTYDACCMLAAYSISVDNLFGDKLNSQSGVEVGEGELVTLSPSEEAVAEYLYERLRADGCSIQVACAILGNLHWESDGLETSRVQYGGGPGRGLAQWTVGGERFKALQKIAKSKGRDWTDLESQADLIISELNNYSPWKKTLKNCHASGIPSIYCEKWGVSKTHPNMTPSTFKKIKDIEKATLIFQNHWEVANPSHYKNRLKLARTYFAKFSKEEYVKGNSYDPPSSSETLQEETAPGSATAFPGMTDEEVAAYNWRHDMKKKLQEYLASDDAMDFYEIDFVTDEDGNVKEYDGVIDRTTDEKDNVKEYDKNTNEDLVDKDELKEELNKDENEETKKENTSAVKQEAEDKNKNAITPPQLKSVSFVKAKIHKKDIVKFALEAFQVTNEDVVELYGEGNKGNTNEIIRSMAMNSLALLHNVNDFEAGYVPPELTGADAYEIGASLGAFEIKYFCMCGKEACERNKRAIFGTNHVFSKSTRRVAGVSCASNTLPINTIIYDEDFGLLVVTEKLPASKVPTLAIYAGKKHDTSKEVIKNIEKILAKNKGGTNRKTFNHVTGILVGDALNSGNGISTGKFLWPLPKGKGFITSTFKWRWGRQHEGVDVGVVTGTPVYAADGGTVIFAGSAGGYGLLVKVKHSNGYETRYAHNSRLAVKSGQKVSKGQIVAYSGNTGRSTGPHLHFEIRKNGTAMDPLKFVKPK